MAEYIEREAAKEAVVKAVGKGHSPFNAIVMLPAADVRPVVVCQYCEHFQPFRPNIDGFCKIDGMLWNNDFFCANGIKREEN